MQKKAGASKWGQIGSFVGLLLGFFGLLPALPVGGPLLGMLIGPLLGAIVGEFIYQRKLLVALKAGIGIFCWNSSGKSDSGNIRNYSSCDFCLDDLVSSFWYMRLLL